MSMLIRENVEEQDRELLKAALSGMSEGSHLGMFLGWLAHELDDHAACISVAMPAPSSTVVLIQRRIPDCHDHG